MPFQVSCHLQINRRRAAKLSAAVLQEELLDIMNAYGSTLVGLVARDMRVPLRKNATPARVQLPRLNSIEIQFTEEDFDGKVLRPSSPGNMFDWIEAPRLDQLGVFTTCSLSGDNIVDLARTLADKARFPMLTAIYGAIKPHRASLFKRMARRRDKGDFGQAAVRSICAERLNVTELEWTDQLPRQLYTEYNDSWLSR